MPDVLEAVLENVVWWIVSAQTLHLYSLPTIPCWETLQHHQLCWCLLLV